jgi:hypothetical protein
MYMSSIHIYVSRFLPSPFFGWAAVKARTGQWRGDLEQSESLPFEMFHEV